MVNKNEIAVLDIETTGYSIKTDSIVDIGICGLNIITGKVRKIFQSYVRESRFLENKYKNAWVFENTKLDISKIVEAPSLNIIRKELVKIFTRFHVVAYNQKFDFSFLEDRGFKIPFQLKDPMIILTPILNIPHDYYGVKYPNVMEVWKFLFPNNKMIEPHEALQDSFMEAKIIFELIKRKEYSLQFYLTGLDRVELISSVI